MHPAYSIIVFTTASGLGYGLLALLGLLGGLGVIAPQPWLGVVGLGIALGFVTLGLLASTLHLGHPERAWRALGQWRSSWLSREGIGAIATYPFALIFAAGWVAREDVSGPIGWSGLIAAALALVTVFCTAMIYASLRAVPRWNNPWVPPVYLALALMTGAVWLVALLDLFGVARAPAAWLAVLAILIAAALKHGYWGAIDRAPPRASAASATGLGGDVRPLDPPHTQRNYLLREMGYAIARKHARKLRRIAALFAFALPLALLLLAWPVAVLAPVLSTVAALSAIVGVAIERWLFFAEAEHAVMLYYGRAAV